MKAPQTGRGRRGRQTRPGQPQRRNGAPQQRTGPAKAGGARNAAHSHLHFLNLAREAASRGDMIEAENCYQYAEHYFRVARESEGR